MERPRDWSDPRTFVARFVHGPRDEAAASLMRLEERRFAVVSAAVALAILLGCDLLGTYASDSPILGLGAEDRVVEHIGAAFWGAATILCGYRLVTGRRPVLLLAFWMMLSFVAMGEETSWFQRLLGIETPAEIAAVNAQGELNFHNLADLPFNPQNAFRLGFVAYFLVLPVLMASSARIRGFAYRFGYVSPHLSFVGMTWAVIGLSVVLSQFGPAEAERIIVEVQESFYGYVVLAYVYFNLRPAAADEPEAASELAAGSE